MSKVVVLGSLNTDMVISANRLPQIGETIIGKDIHYMIGGKGANQAVAASRIGAEVTMLGKLGDDTFGNKIIKHLQQEQLNLDYLAIEKNIFTGIANIFKLPMDNCITVIPGANDLVDTVYLDSATAAIKNSQVLLAQLEIPPQAVAYGLKMAKENQAITILNPAPYTPEVADLIKWSDFLTPNETEFAALYGKAIESDKELEQAMLTWSKAHPTVHLIVTRGAHGTSFVKDDAVVTIPTINVQVTDTTGAGDTFNGILAVKLSEGCAVEEAIRMAGIGASLSVQKFGAQSGMPTRKELEAADK